MHRRLSVDQRAASAQKPINGLKRLLSYLKPYRLELAAVFILVIISSVLNILGPYLLGLAIDNGVVAQDWDELLRMVLIILGNFLLMWAIDVTYRRMMTSTAQKAMRNMRESLFNHMQELSIGYYDKQTAGDLMSRLTNDMDAITRLLSLNIMFFISSFSTLIGILVMMFSLNTILTLAALIIIPLTLLTTTIIIKRSRPAYQELQKSLGQLNGLMEEDLSGQRVIIAYGKQGISLKEFKVYNESVREIGVKANILAGLMHPITGILSILNVIVVVGVGAYMLIQGVGGVTIGLITAFSEYTRRFGHPINQIANLFNSVMAALAGAERIFEIIDAEPAVVDRPDAIPLDSLEGEVQFTHVHFGYSNELPVLKDVNFVAEPGRTMALVGPTGAGKTTIINLLTRFYDIDSGEILIDGHDIRAIKQDDLRRKLGIVLQDTFLFADTVKENIRYGRLDASDEEVVEAATLANADGFIKRLPEGYETELSERGSNLSQGQRQLLAIARAILADPAILILDEATSSVDTRTEIEIQKALLKLMEGRTSFVIAHRLSTIRNADQILVINEGQLIERGRHEELLDKKGFYHNLYTSQFKGLPVEV